ncbi:PAS domain S-box protein [Maridesulfovibrio zosterae]|uniref:PAS domain S-box protein n=1 Tax=Maridesulfovibrio zosterae TaxID=82171 RepID=UPI0004017432|nr:PAS domain S-box protein [Maridesulfovibrio zosterae]
MNFQELIKVEDQPVISADFTGAIVCINKAFTAEFGWTETELVGNSLTKIIPSALRDAHQLGFSAYLATDNATLLGQHLDLEILAQDGRILMAEHFILSGEINGQKAFAAQIKILT